MLRKLVLLFFISFAGISASTEPRDDSRAADKQAIRSHIEKIFKAYVDGDCATIKATHSQNWIGFTGSARSILHGLDEYMNSSARFCQQQSAVTPGAQRSGLADYKITEIDYMFYGDVALVPYVADTWYGKERVPGKLRSLDIYVKTNGEWNQVGSNIYPHPDMVQQQFRQMQQFRRLQPETLKALLAAREAVWRAFFAGDQAQLEKVIPQEAMAIEGSGEEPIANRAAILEQAKRVAASGAKLTRLEFPRTEVQAYGDTVILYTTYLYELENAKGERRTERGRGTEIFVNRDGTWVNTGWSLQPDKS